jgi:hypothetical protein
MGFTWVTTLETTIHKLMPIEESIKNFELWTYLEVVKFNI